MAALRPPRLSHRCFYAGKLKTNLATHALHAWKGNCVGVRHSNDETVPKYTSKISHRRSFGRLRRTKEVPMSLSPTASTQAAVTGNYNPPGQMLGAHLKTGSQGTVPRQSACVCVCMHTFTHDGTTSHLKKNSWREALRHPPELLDPALVPPGVGSHPRWRGLPRASEHGRQHGGSPPTGRRAHPAHVPAGTSKNVSRRRQMFPADATVPGGDPLL